MINLNELRDRAYKCACEHGFHDKEYSDEHYLMLIITELSEAVEADRKKRHANIEAFNRLYNGSDSKFGFEKLIKDTVEEELADTVISLLDLFGKRNIFLDESGFDEETFQDYANIYKDRSFTESVYYIVGELLDKTHSITESCMLPEIVLLEIFGLAKHLDIDLIWYIEQKMKYNELN